MNIAKLTSGYSASGRCSSLFLAVEFFHSGIVDSQEFIESCDFGYTRRFPFGLFFKQKGIYSGIGCWLGLLYKTNYLIASFSQRG
jgi:hypothetical protein